MSKVLSALKAKHPEKIIEIEDDRYNENGWWIHLKDGWWNHLTQCHSIHEDTVVDCLAQFRMFVKPCKANCQCRWDK